MYETTKFLVSKFNDNLCIDFDFNSLLIHVPIGKPSEAIFTKWNQNSRDYDIEVNPCNELDEEDLKFANCLISIAGSLDPKAVL